MYGQPPWIFTGRALYQLHLVKTEEAKKYIPPGFNVVDFFGYTLGGFYLARYDGSPVGPLDELVVLAGLIWNPPTSCAWAARVLVNDRQARDHGLRHVGLPSRLARFQWLPSTTSVASRPAGKATPAPAPQTSWRGQGHGEGSSAAGTGSSSSSEGGSSRLVKSGTLQIHNVDNIRGRSLRGPLCTLMLPPGGPPKWGPKINLKLPSFSGATIDHPGRLKYALDLVTGVRLVKPVVVSVPSPADGKDADEQQQAEAMRSILTARPLITLAFDGMHMKVGRPEPIP